MNIRCLFGFHKWAKEKFMVKLYRGPEFLGEKTKYFYHCARCGKVRIKGAKAIEFLKIACLFGFHKWVKVEFAVRGCELGEFDCCARCGKMNVYKGED